jgi:hypothetical protein
MGISILAWLSSLDPYSWANMGRGMITMPMWKDEVEAHIGPGNMDLDMEMIL